MDEAVDLSRLETGTLTLGEKEFTLGDVIERAREVLKFHESREHAVSEGLTPQHPAAAPLQIRLFEPSTNELAEKIRELNLDEMRPIDALRFLHELQKAVS